jgi:hypothetical protein
MLKRRRLSADQKVIIIYNKAIGFVREEGTFQGYRRIMIHETSHEIPVFKCGNREVTGLECFWVLPSDVQDEKHLERMQKELLDVQVRALEVGKNYGYFVPSKIIDRELEQMAQENHDRKQALIQKFGFDPFDESWVEKELAENDQERNWFKFERENGLMFAARWDEIIKVFNQHFEDSIDIETAKTLSKKRMRYLLGAYMTRTSGNPDPSDWKKAAVEFEQAENKREKRMISWTEQHKGNFPIARLKRESPFWYGPYFNQCIEAIPHVFVTPDCKELKKGTMLRVLSYDPEEHFICVDFLPDIRQRIKGENDPNQETPWKKDGPDYEIPIGPNQVESHLEFLEKLE